MCETVVAGGRMGVASSDFLVSLRPQLCGSSSYAVDTPECGENPEPIDLDSYLLWGKFLDLIPFYTHPTVRFVRRFKKDPILSDTTKHCGNLSANFRGWISETVEKMDVDPQGNPTGVPTESRIYGKMRDDTLPASIAFDKRYRDKAKELRRQLEEIARLRAKKDQPAEDVMIDLMEASARVCIVDDDIALGNLNRDGSEVLAANAEIKGWVQKGIGGLITFWALIRTGVLPKMIAAAKATWKESRRRDDATGKKPDNFFMSIIKTIGAFFTASAPQAAESRGNAWPYRDEAAVDVAYSKLETTIGRFTAIAGDPYVPDTAKGQIRLLNAALERTTREGRRFALPGMAPALFNEATLGTYESLREAYTRWFLDDILTSVASLSLSATGAIERGDAAAEKQLVGEIAAKVSRVGETELRFKGITSSLRETLEDVEKLLVVRNGGLMGKWKMAIRDTRYLNHDIANISNPVINGVTVLTRPTTTADKKLGMLRIFSSFDISHLDTSLGMVAGLNKSRTEDKHVAVKMRPAPRIAVPQEVRYDLFRVVNEFAINAVKYSDPAKPDSSVRISAAEQGQGSLRIDVVDNGVGIRDTAAVFEPGARERPDLAEGTGMGLASVHQLAERHGWRVELSSILGEGTKASLTIDTSKWGRSTSAAAVTAAGVSGVAVLAGAGLLTSTLPALYTSVSPLVSSGLGLFAGI